MKNRFRRRKQCKGKTSYGNRCKRYPLINQDYCKDHLNQFPRELASIDRLSDKYYLNNPAIRALFQLIPYGVGSAFDTYLATRVHIFREKRKDVFFEELARGNILLTEEIIRSDDFLHCYFITVKAALDTRRNEKIRMFARLLKFSTQSGSLTDIDEYEDYLNILDDITIREIKALIALENYEAKYYTDARFDEKKAPNLSAEGLFQEEAEKVFGSSIPDYELKGMVIRLNRTGCYTMMGWRNGPAHDCSLTEIYFHLKALIEDEHGKLM